MAVQTNTGRAMARHPEETVQLSLRTLALCGGDIGRALELLTSQLDNPPAKRTLQSWRDNLYAHRYEEMLHEYRSELNDRTAAQASALASRATGTAQKLIEMTEKKIDDIPEKDLARSALAMTQITAEQSRTGRLLREQPTSIVDHGTDPLELVKELQALGVIKKPKQDEAIDVQVVDETN